MKRMLVHVASETWALASHEDAIALLGIFQRAIKAKQEGYRGPYFAEDDQTPPIDGVTLADVAEKVEAAGAIDLATMRQLP